jgi:osmotically-inducible protein OsmY
MAVATETRTDAQIQSDVLAEVKWDQRVQPNEVGVVVNDGVVTLDGSIRTPRDTPPKRPLTVSAA